MSPLLVCGAAALYLVSRDAYCTAEGMFVFRSFATLPRAASFFFFFYLRHIGVFNVF